MCDPAFMSSACSVVGAKPPGTTNAYGAPAGATRGPAVAVVAAGRSGPSSLPNPQPASATAASATAAASIPVRRRTTGYDLQLAAGGQLQPLPERLADVALADVDTADGDLLALH